MPANDMRPGFRPPTDWETVFAADPDGWTFGEEPSQIARSALRYFRAFGGDPARAAALDLGSGEGRDTAFLAAAGLHVTARDVAPTGLIKTRKLLQRQGVPSGQVDLALGDVRDFVYPTAGFDIALAANVYQFLAPADVPAHIARLQRTVRLGGLCGLAVFSPAMKEWGAHLDGHYTATARDLAALFSAEDGWLVLDRTDYTNWRIPQQTWASWAYVVARKDPKEGA